MNKNLYNLPNYLSTSIEKHILDKSGEPLYGLIKIKGTVLDEIRLIVLRDIPDLHVEKFDLGGIISRETVFVNCNNIWISYDSHVRGHSIISGDVTILDSEISDSTIYGNKLVIKDSVIRLSHLYSDNKESEVTNHTVVDCIFHGPFKIINTEFNISKFRIEKLRLSDVLIDDRYSYIFVKGFGSVGIARNTVFYINTNNKIMVKCGCFSGSVEEFKKQIIHTHDGSVYKDDYFKLIDVCVKVLSRKIQSNS